MLLLDHSDALVVASERFQSGSQGPAARGCSGLRTPRFGIEEAAWTLEDWAVEPSRLTEAALQTTVSG